MKDGRQAVLEAIDVILEQFLSETPGCRPARPGRAAILFPGAHQQALALLAQIVLAVRIADHRQLVVEGLHARHRLGHQVLMFHVCDGHVGADHVGNFVGPETRAVHDSLAFEKLIAGRQPPVPGWQPRNTVNLGVATNLAAVFARPGGKSHGNGIGIDVTFFRVPGAPFQIRDIHQRIPGLDLSRRDQLVFKPKGTELSREVFELLHALTALGKKKSTYNVGIHRLTDLFRQTIVETQGIGLQRREIGIGRLCMHITGGVPCCACGQLPSFQQQRVLLPRFRQVIQGRYAYDPTADNDNSSLNGHVGFNSAMCRRQLT